MPSVDAVIAEMLITRMCHDMAGPVSAINNGLEFLGDDSDPAMQQQCKDLLSLSAQENLAKLQVFRLCFGQLKEISEVNVEEFIEIFQQYFANSPINLSWQSSASSGFSDVVSNHARRLIANMLFVASMELAFGGVITLEQSDKLVTVTGTHDRIKNDKDIKEILQDNGLPDATPRNVPAFFLRNIVREAGMDITYHLTSEENGKEKVEITINIM